VIEALIAPAAALLLGAALQSAVGFGMGLFAIPILVWAGAPLPAAVATMIGAVIAQTTVGCYRLRSHVRWGDALRFSTYRWLMMPVGVWFLHEMGRWQAGAVKRVVGTAVLAGIVLTERASKSADAPGPILRGALGAVSGFLAGAVGMGGPPLVLYVLRQRQWRQQEQRAYLWSLFLLGAPAQAALIAWHFGLGFLSHICFGLLLAPVVWVGSELGLRIGRDWSRETLRSAALVLLVLVALMSIVGPELGADSRAANGLPCRPFVRENESACWPRAGAAHCGNRSQTQWMIELPQSSTFPPQSPAPSGVSRC